MFHRPDFAQQKVYFTARLCRVATQKIFLVTLVQWRGLMSPSSSDRKNLHVYSKDREHMGSQAWYDDVRRGFGFQARWLAILWHSFPLGGHEKRDGCQCSQPDLLDRDKNLARPEQQEITSWKYVLETHLNKGYLYTFWFINLQKSSKNTLWALCSYKLGVSISPICFQKFPLKMLSAYYENLCQPACLPVCLPICLSVCLPVCLSVCACLCLSLSVCL